VSEGPVSFGEDVPVAAATPLDGLLADFAAATAAHESVEIDVPGKPGRSVRYGTDLPYEMVAAWRKAAMDPTIGFNELLFASSVVVFACQAIRTNGEDFTDNGQPVTFNSSALQAALGVSRPVDAARRFYGKDGHVIAVAARLLNDAGYGAEAHPTSR
jgi:hypothetical protein